MTTEVIKYPKWKYAQGASQIVGSAEEEEALEGDWYDTPADVPAPKAPKGKGAAAAQAADQGA